MEANCHHVHAELDRSAKRIRAAQWVTDADDLQTKLLINRNSVTVEITSRDPTKNRRYVLVTRRPAAEGVIRDDRGQAYPARHVQSGERVDIDAPQHLVLERGIVNISGTRIEVDEETIAVGDQTYKEGDELLINGRRAVVSLAKSTNA